MVYLKIPGQPSTWPPLHQNRPRPDKLKLGKITNYELYTAWQDSRADAGCKWNGTVSNDWARFDNLSDEFKYELVENITPERVNQVVCAVLSAATHSAHYVQANSGMIGRFRDAARWGYKRGLVSARTLAVWDAYKPEGNRMKRRKPYPNRGARP